MWFKPAEYQNSNHSVIATIATTATKTLENPDLSQLSRKSQVGSHSEVHSKPFNSVAIVANVATGLSAVNRQKLLDYLAATGETDPEIIDELLTECGKDAALLARQLQQADDYLKIKPGEYTGLVQCSGCNHLASDACNRHGWRVVVDKWRRCGDYDAEPVVITCRSCSHFESFNNHGGGAGACAAGVMPHGACWWADTVHECEKYQAMGLKNEQ